MNSGPAWGYGCLGSGCLALTALGAPVAVALFEVNDAYTDSGTYPAAEGARGRAFYDVTLRQTGQYLVEMPVRVEPAGRVVPLLKGGRVEASPGTARRKESQAVPLAILFRLQ